MIEQATDQLSLRQRRSRRGMAALANQLFKEIRELDQDINYCIIKYVAENCKVPETAEKLDELRSLREKRAAEFLTITHEPR